ncbi:hypothetical protein XELAEV_18030675mg [Xenopus laevis]|uniref:Uncharacterized protein n=1 Tax=Xenopus laevis TaxID=8355 RepID=A0A974CMP8_XENLA|nr:hypothetical protein XELAEV_18030675mg [Xenopus laevis]
MCVIMGCLEPTACRPLFVSVSFLVLNAAYCVAVLCTDLCRGGLIPHSPHLNYYIVTLGMTIRSCGLVLYGRQNIGLHVELALHESGSYWIHIGSYCTFHSHVAGKDHCRTSVGSIVVPNGTFFCN